jgi:peptide/nickel transport system ATP-binding protein
MLTLQANDLEVTLRIGGAVVPAIRSLSFDLAPKKILGLVGESGAGKSMVGRAIAQLLPPGFAITGGSLMFDSVDLLHMPAARRRALLGRSIAFIPQAPLSALNPVMTVAAQFNEHLARIDGTAGAGNRRERIVAMLEAARLPQAGELLGRYPHQLSGGMCQRVLIAMAFAGNPRLVIADEPTTALDVTMHGPIIRLIADMQRDHGTAVIFITHDLRLAAQICDDIVVMYGGRAVERGPARAVLSSPAHPYTRCLQLANPSMHADRHALYVMPEQMPSLSQLAGMAGCHFAPRCPLVMAECRSGSPPNVPIADDRSAACIRATAAASIAAGGPLDAAASPSARSLLDVDSLEKHYIVGGGLLGRARTVAAVKAASFSIAEGEFVALVGESGSGKSTIAKVLAGLEPPSAGRIVLDGEDLSNPRRRRASRHSSSIQMVFQDPYSALNPRRRIASIVTQAMEAGKAHATSNQRFSRTRELLADVGMAADFAQRLPGQLSGGQRQRVNIARALCNIPKVLIADEIVSGLDVSIQAQLLNLLVRLRAEFGFAMLFISHDLSVVRHLCSRVLVMYRGEIVEQGPIETVFAEPRHPHTRTLISSVPPDEPGARWPMLQTN